MPIKNRSTAWSKNQEKYFQLPKITTTNLETAASLNEGGLVYDDSTNTVKFSNGSSWAAVGGGGGGGSPTLNDITSPTQDASITSSTYSFDYIVTGSVGAGDNAFSIINQEADPTTSRLLGLVFTADGDPHPLFLACADNNDADVKFSIGLNGLTTIAGNARGTNALVLTAGDATVTSGDVVVTNGLVNANTSADIQHVIGRNNATGTNAAIKLLQDHATGGKAILLDQDATAAGSYALDIDTEGGTAIHFADLIAAGDGVLVDVANSWTGQAMKIDAGPWLGTVNEGAGFDFRSDSGAVGEKGSVIYVKLGGTSADDAAILGKVLYAEDEAATTSGSYLVNLDSANNGALNIAAGLFKTVDQINSAPGATKIAYNLDLPTAYNVAGGAIDIDTAGTGSGPILTMTHASTYTGDMLKIDMTNAVGAKLENYTSAGTRTANLNTITDSSAGAVDVYQIDDSGTKSGHIWDVNVSGNSIGNTVDIVYSASKVAGHALHVDLGTGLASKGLLIDAAGTRTEPIIHIANTGADGGTDDHVIFINQTGLLNSDLVNLTYATAASDGNALMIAMGTNVAGSGIQMTSAGTGTSGEGCGVDITHTGNLAAGANLVDIISTGSPSSTSHTVSIQQTTGAGSAGAYALYINATGTNVEALKVDAGIAVFDEAVTITGLATLTAGIDAKVIFAGTEDIAAGGTSTALSLSKSQHTIACDAGGDTFTLADGVNGQIMTILCKAVNGGTCTITPATFANGTSITFDAIGDTVMLQFATTTGWFIIGGNSYTII